MNVVLYIALSAFLLRVIPRLIRPYSLGSDTYYHLVCAESIRQNKMKIPKRIAGMVLPGEYIYPYLYHLMLALFPKEKRDKAEIISSPVFDTVMILISAMMAYYVISESMVAGKSKYLLHFMLLMVTAPSMLNVSAGPRAYHGTARTMGEMLYVLVMVSLYMFLKTSAPIGLVVGIVSGALLLLTSKFAVQVYVSFSIIISIVLGNIYVLLLPTGSFVVAMIISRGKYLNILRNQVKHLYLYATSLIHVYHKVKKHRILGTIGKLMGSLRSLDLKNAIDIIMNDIPLTGLMVKSPAVYIAAFCLIKYNYENAFIYSWFMASAILFVLSSFRYFKFIGEAERYFEYSLVPQYLIIVTTLPPRSLTFILLGQILLYFAFVAQLTYMNRFNNTSNEKNKNECFSELKKYCGKGAVATITGVRPNDVVYKTGCNVLNTESLSALSKEEIQYLYRSYPYLSDSAFMEILYRYNCVTVLVRKISLKYAENMGMRYPLHRLKKVFENDGYEIYVV